MKITIDVDLEDLLTEVEDEESGYTYYVPADNQEIKNNIKNRIESTILDNVNYKTSNIFINEAKDIIRKHTNEIVETTIKNVTERIMNSKKIMEFRRELLDKMLKEFDNKEV